MDETISYHLFPRHWFFWFLWIIVLLIVFPLYYTDSDYYSAINKEYEREKWSQCAPNSPCAEAGRDASGVWGVFVRQPKYISDFVERPLEIVVTNNTTMTQSAVLNIEMLPKNNSGSYVLYRFGDQQQNFVNVENIQPHGQASYRFMVKAVGGSNENGQNGYTLAVYINDFAILGSPSSSYTTTFDSMKVLKLWGAEYLLSPPAAHLIIPVVLLLIVSVSQSAYVLSSNILAQLLRTEKTASELLIEGIFAFKKHINIVRIVIILSLGTGLIFCGWRVWEAYLTNSQEFIPSRVFQLFLSVSWQLILIGFAFGLIWESLVYKKDKDVQKIEIVRKIEIAPTERER